MTEGTACRLSPLPGFSESIPLGEYRRYSHLVCHNYVKRAIFTFGAPTCSNNFRQHSDRSQRPHFSIFVKFSTRGTMYAPPFPHPHTNFQVVCSSSLFLVHFWTSDTFCNVCTPQAELTLRNPEAGSAYRLSPQSPVSRVFRICFKGDYNSYSN